MNIIEKFYQALTELDAEKMAACYHDDIVFEDPAFGELKGTHAGNMWRMLLKGRNNKGFKVIYSDIKLDETSGSAHWEAFYVFSKTGRKVHNIIDARFKIQEGKIIDHRDHFDLHRWSRQAIGPVGLLIGWTAFFRKKLNKQTNALLAKFESKLES